MEINKSETADIDLKELFFVLLHKLWIIVIVGIIGAVGSWAVSTYLIEPIYTSKTKVYVINRQDENNITLLDLQIGSQLTMDYVILVKSRPVTEQVIRDLNLKMTSEELADIIQVNIPMDTRILEIIVQHHNSSMAKQIADALAEVSSERMISVMDMGVVNVVEEGNLPNAPSDPNVMKNTILGGLLGGFAASFIILLVYMMNDSIQTSEDIEKYLGMTTLGMLPVEEGTHKKKHKKERKIKQSRKNEKTALAS